MSDGAEEFVADSVNIAKWVTQALAEGYTEIVLVNPHTGEEKTVDLKGLAASGG